jgi:hypothetical protein
MSNSSSLKCRNLYGSNAQNLGIYDTVKKDVFQQLRTSENDDAHIKLCLTIAKLVKENFRKFNSINDDKSKRLSYALENGAFFIDDMYNGKMGSKAITINEYNSLTPELKEKARPVIPGDEISYTGAFGMDNASHHGVYMGTNSKDKIGLTIEVDGMFPTLSHSEFYYTLIMMSAIGGGAGLIRCYRNLNEFTFNKDIASNAKHDTTNNDSTIIYEDEFTSSRKMILAESPNLDPNYIYETLNRAVDGLICKIWEYNPITSNCEHFAKICVTRKFETLQGLTQNILTAYNTVGIASGVLNFDISKVPDLVTILKFYNDNNDVLTKALDDMSSGNEIKNKAQFTNTLKALVLIIQDNKEISITKDIAEIIPTTNLLIKKEAFKLLKKLHTYEINRPKEKRLVTDESRTIMDDLLSAINEVSDEDLNEPSILMSTLLEFNQKFDDLIDKYSKESGMKLDVIKGLFDFSNIGGNLNLPILNPIGIGAIEVDKFDELSETFIGEMLATRGGRRKYKHTKTKKINKKYKRRTMKTKRIMKTKRNKSKRYRRR